MKPLYVRLPTEEAERLDRAVEQLRTSKRELITRLVSQQLHTLTVGHHEFRPAPAPDVLTAAQAAELLRVDEPAVLELAESAELPGRKVAGEWRFARTAVLRWLESA